MPSRTAEKGNCRSTPRVRGIISSSWKLGNHRLRYRESAICDIVARPRNLESLPRPAPRSWGWGCPGIRHPGLCALGHFQAPGEFLPDFLGLGRDHEHAVRLSRIVCKVVLVIVLGNPERRRWLDGRDNGVLEDPVVGQIGYYFLCSPLLLIAKIENDGTVLFAHVVALPVQRG